SDRNNWLCDTLGRTDECDYGDDGVVSKYARICHRDGILLQLFSVRKTTNASWCADTVST
ncbi:hypothetical protein ANCDUO_17043, partial [Ancylostoma duodenale]